MMADRKRIRAHLAAAFDDADAIETRPIEEVRAELAALGVDPAVSIRLAEKLRSGGESPATRLLNKLERLDDVDAEIEAFETGDIDDLGTNLPTDQAELVQVSQSPGGASRRTGGAGRVSFLGWGGSLIGIAACLFLYIAVQPDGLEERAPFDAPSDVADMSSLDAPEMSEMPKASETNELAARGTVERRSFAADQPMLQATPSGLADRADHAADLTKGTVPSPASFVLPSSRGEVVAVLIVDDRAPAVLHSLARTVTDNDLSAKLEEAKRLASGRTVLALMRFVEDGQESVSALLDDPAAGFELINLGEPD